LRAGKGGASERGALRMRVVLELEVSSIKLLKGRVAGDGEIREKGGLGKAWDRYILRRGDGRVPAGAG